MWEFLKVGLYARWITTYDPVKMIWWVFRHYGWLCFITLMVYVFAKNQFEDHIENVKLEAENVREGIEILKFGKEFRQSVNEFQEELIDIRDQLDKEYEDM